MATIEPGRTRDVIRCPVSIHTNGIANNGLVDNNVCAAATVVSLNAI